MMVDDTTNTNQVQINYKLIGKIVLNLRERLYLSAGWLKNLLKKRSIDGYLSIF